MTSRSGRRAAPREPSSGRDGVPDSVLLLAAVDRAARHEGRSLRAIGLRAEKRMAVPVFVVATHLGYEQDARSKRRLRRQLDELTQEGLLEVSEGRSPTLWALTNEGRQALARHQGRASAATLALPESPQHETWREARRIAGLQIAALRSRFQAALDRTSADAGTESTDPAVWLDLADACWRLGAATYCLYEWPEPDDANADAAPEPDRRGLRDWRKWSLPLPPCGSPVRWSQVSVADDRARPCR
jgi:hypothetical protein